MPIYQRNGKTYNIPESEMDGFEKTYPDATQKYVASGRKYNIPVSERDGFLSLYKDATPIDREPNVAPELKTDIPIDVDSQRMDNGNVKGDVPISHFVQGKGKDATIFGVPYSIYTKMKPETQSHYYQKALDEERDLERKQIEEQIAQQKQVTDEGLKKAYQEHSKKEKEEADQKSWFRKIIEGVSEASRDVHRGFPLSPIHTDENIRKYHAASESVSKAEELVNESKHKVETGLGAGLSGFGRGFWDKMSKLSTWDMGMLDMSKNTEVLNAVQKFDRNQPLTVEEETLLDAVALEAAANGEFSGDLGRGYKAGSTTAVSLPFMAEFMINPATGTGRSVGKVAAKKIITNFGKEAAKSTIGKIARNSARVVGDIAGAGIMTGTTGAMRTTADAVDRSIGEVKPIVDSDGYYHFGGTDGGDGALEAFVKAYGASTIENFSEMFGNYLAPIGGALGTGAGKVMNKIGLGRVNKIIGDIKSSDVAKMIDDFQSRTQWNGTIGEYLEEQAGIAMNSLTVGDNKLSDMIDPDTQIDTFLGVSALGGFFSSIKTTGYAREKYKAKKRLNEADHFAAGPNAVGTKEWTDLKGQIDQADDSELVSILSGVMSDTNISDEGKQAALIYAGRLKAYHGSSLADLKRKVEGDTPDELVQSQMNFDEGYKLAEAGKEEKRKAIKELNNVESKLDDEFLFADDDGRYELLRQRADAGENVSNELAYINAESRFNGMITGIRDVIDEKVATSNQYITNLTHQDGNVYDVTLTVDEKKHVFPISGKIVFDENGIVDRKQSDSRFIVRDDTGKVEMRSVEDLYKLESSNNADVLKDITAQSIREQESARHAEEIETPSEEEKAEEIAFIQPGDVVSLDMQGTKATATVQSKNNGSTILQFDEPIEYNGKKSQIIELSDEQVQSIIIPEAENTDVLMETDVENNGLPLEEQNDLLNNEEAIATNEVPATPAIENTSINVEPVNDIPVQEQMTVAPVEVDGVQENQTEVIPVDKKGNKIYHKVPVDVSLEDMRNYGLDDVETDEFVNSQKVEAAKRVEKLQKGKPKVGTNLEKYQMDKKTWTDEMADAQAQTDYWNEIEAQIQAIRERPGDTVAEEIKSMGEPINGGELAAVMLGNGKLPLLYGDYKRETGFSNADAHSMFGMFASKENGGMTIEQAGEQLMLADLENGTNFFDQNDPNAGRNAIIEVLSSARTRGDLINYINKGREVMAERERRAEYEAFESWSDEYFHMSPEDFEAYEESSRPLIEEKYKEFDEEDFYGNIADELKQRENDTQREITGTVESGAVLHREELVSSERAGSSEGRQGSTVQTSLQGGIEDGTVSEITSENKQVNSQFITPSHNEGESVFEYAERVNDAHLLHQEEQEVNTNPTDAQKEAGNYKKGHIKIDGFDITIENPRGSERSGVDAHGNTWSVTMNNTYGYIRGTEGVDGDHIDMFLGNTGNGVYVVDQVKEDGSFDEHKVMYGFGSIDEAKNAYLSNYSSGWNGLGNITEVSKDDFKKWIQSSKRKTKPFVEYGSVKLVNVADTENDKNYLKAPNGKPTSLNEKQWKQVRTKAFKDWFGDWENEPENASKVVDENGEPLVVYHGTSTGGFSIFNTYGSNFGLFGQGSYFTDTREVAESYMDKGNGDSKRVYGVFLNIRHPLDMNSHNIAEGWKEALPDDISVEIGEDSTNESVYKSVLESFEYNEYPKSEAQEILYDLPVALGYDGVTHIGGGRYNKTNDTRHQVWIAMEPTQIKSATDNSGEFSGDNGDIRFREVYHGSPHDFGQFNHSFMNTGEGVQAFGWGTYVTEVNGIAKGYAETLASRSQAKRINELARSVATKKDFIKTRKQDIKRNDDYDKYARAIKKNLKGLYAELKKAKKEENEKDARFYQSLIDVAEQQLDHDYYNNLLDSFWNDINYTQKEIDEMEKEIADLNRQIKKLKGKRHLYTVEIPDSDGMNYLKWNEPLTVTQKNMIAEQAEKEGYGDYQISYRNEHGNLVLNSSGDVTGEALYRELSKEFLLGSDKATSEFLNRAGFVGIEYPAEAMSGGREDNAKNYVIFNEKDLAIEEHVRFRDKGNDTIKAYHGSGAEFAKFDLSHSGEGKGESMLGKGVYTTKDKHIARNYADVASNREIGGRKHLYEVEIPTDNGENYLDYDKVYDMEEMSEIAKRLRNVGVNVDFGRYFNGGKANGKNLYMVMDWNMPDGMNVNQALSDAGYVGYKYSTRHDLGGKEKHFPKKSYVVFDEDNTSISNHEQVESEIEKLSDLLHVPVKMVRSLEELSDDGMARRAIENGRNVKGWFDTKTGEVVVYLPNATGEEDAKATFLHEIVGHKGLRALIGEKSYDDEMVRLYGLLPSEERKMVTNAAVHDYGGNVAVAMDEYLAEQAEKDETPSWWNKAASAIRDCLRKMGIEVSLSGNDVKYLLWRSRKNLERNNPLEIAADVDMRNKLGIGEYGTRAERFRETTDKESLFDSAERIVEQAKISKNYDNAVSVVNEFHEKCPGACKTLVIKSKDTLRSQMEAIHIDLEDIDKYERWFDENKTIAFYVPKYGRVIVLDTNYSKEDLNAYLWHENVHAALNNLENRDDVISRIVPLINTHVNYIIEQVDSGYSDKSDDEKREEYVTHFFEELLINEKESLMLNGDVRLRDVEANNAIKEILNYINNGREKEYDGSRSDISRRRTGDNGGGKIAFNGKMRNSKRNIGYEKEGGRVWNDLRSILNEGEEQLRRKTEEQSNGSGIEVPISDNGGNPEIHERVLARDRYERRVRSGMYQTQEALQDSMLGLKEAMDAILKAEGTDKYIEDISGFENAYLGENSLSSVNKAEADAFAHTIFKPMLEEVVKFAKNETERWNLTDYMMAKHGLERNANMAERDAQEEIKAGSTESYDDILAKYRQKDYAGLTALTGIEDVADAEEEARRMVDDYERDNDTEELWKKVNSVSNAILEKSYQSGLMSKATYKKVKEMYEFYIPLRGFDEKTSDEAYAYLSSKQSAFNAPIKTAKGRKSKADDPFANLESMAESTIMQGNRNRLVKQRFLNFALNHPSDLVSVSDLWLAYDKTSDEWKPAFPDNIEDTDTTVEVEKKMKDFEEKMEKLSEKYPDQYKHGKDAENIPYRVVESRDLRQHQIVVKCSDYVVTVNGNPRAAQAINGQTNPDNDLSGSIGAILKVGEMVNRQLSAFYTTRNPDFVVSNFIRDMIYSNIMAWVKETPNYALRFNRNFAMVNPAKMKMLFSKYRKGEIDMNNTTEKMFHQFIMNGGETGYTNVRDVEQRKNDIRRELKRSNGKLKISHAISLLGERLDEYNRSVENCARFSAFVTSREMGRSIDRSIYDAKEISVNFNKKGSGSKFLGTTGQTSTGNASAFVSGAGRIGYVFWNAAIQGSTNFGRQFKRHPAKAFTGAAAMFALGAIMAGIGGDDDDEDKNAYYNLPEYVRRSNILFRMGDQWISIPLPVEYRALYGMGELMISTLNGKEHQTGGEIVEAIAGQVSQILPIDIMEGSGGLNAFVPSAAKPIYEAYVSEKGWTGMPLYKDTPYNKDMPEWTKAYKSANKYIVNLCAVLNEVKMPWQTEFERGDEYTKGAIDLNPSKIEYMLNGYFGGASGTIDKLSKTAETIAGQREYDPRSFLFLNRILKNGDESTEYRAVNNEYFRLKDEHDNLKSRLKHYEEDTYNDIFDYAEKVDFLYNSPEYERYEIFENYKDDINALYEELKEIIGDDERKVVESELNKIKKEMIDEMNLTRKRK